MDLDLSAFRRSVLATAHQPGGAECLQPTTEADGNEIGLRLSNPCQPRYFYSAKNNQDSYNLVTSSSVSGEVFSASASASKFQSGFQPDNGVGLGISLSGCASFDPSNPGYLDSLTLNQDKEFGVFGGGFTKRNGIESQNFYFDATMQCKG